MILRTLFLALSLASFSVVADSPLQWLQDRWETLSADTSIKLSDDFNYSFPRDHDWALVERHKKDRVDLAYLYAKKVAETSPNVEVKQKVIDIIKSDHDLIDMLKDDDELKAILLPVELARLEANEGVGWNSYIWLGYKESYIHTYKTVIGETPRYKTLSILVDLSRRVSTGQNHKINSQYLDTKKILLGDKFETTAADKEKASLYFLRLYESADQHLGALNDIEKIFNDKDFLFALFRSSEDIKKRTVEKLFNPKIEGGPIVGQQYSDQALMLAIDTLSQHKLSEITVARQKAEEKRAQYEKERIARVKAAVERDRLKETKRLAKLEEERQVENERQRILQEEAPKEAAHRADLEWKMGALNERMLAMVSAEKGSREYKKLEKEVEFLEAEIEKLTTYLYVIESNRAQAASQEADRAAAAVSASLAAQRNAEAAAQRAALAELQAQREAIEKERKRAASLKMMQQGLEMMRGPAPSTRINCTNHYFGTDCTVR